jgi:hypothetical protein
MISEAADSQRSFLGIMSCRFAEDFTTLTSESTRSKRPRTVAAT